MATIGWIDFSTSDRNRVGSVLDLLRPEGMVDELGMGTIRNAIADQFFPGISTIQTRAKYFFIVPYILYDFQSSRSAQGKDKYSTKYLENREYEIMWALAEKYEYKEGSGVIGISKRKPNKIVRRPSAIYWKGLNIYRFINTRGLSAEEFLKSSVSKMESLLSLTQTCDDTSSDDIDLDYTNLFELKVSPPKNWTVDLNLDLTKEEAEFFNDRIISVAKNKLISILLQDKGLWAKFDETNDFMQFSKMAISIPISETLKSMLILAHDFSELLYGAHLAYNCQLQRKVFKNDCFDAAWDTWLNEIQENMLDYDNFNPDKLFEYATTTRKTTIEFVNEWWRQTQNKFPQKNKIRDALIEKQEVMVKGGKARLRWGKTDDLKEHEWIGLKHFDYRFSQGKNILDDIKKGKIKQNASS